MWHHIVQRLNVRTSALNISFKAQEGLTISAVKEEVQMLTLLGYHGLNMGMAQLRGHPFQNSPCERTLRLYAPAMQHKGLGVPGVLWN